MINLWVATTRGLIRADWIVGVRSHSNGDLRLTTASIETDYRGGVGPDEFLAAERTPRGTDRALVEVLAVAQAKGSCGVITFGSKGPVLEKFE